MISIARVALLVIAIGVMSVMRVIIMTIHALMLAVAVADVVVAGRVFMTIHASPSLYSMATLSPSYSWALS
jgi:hypothetical protein